MSSIHSCIFAHYGLLLFFFFKQKTTYEMRISDLSSDVCSSDLLYRRIIDNIFTIWLQAADSFDQSEDPVEALTRYIHTKMDISRGKTGRASCRERVCQYV